MDVWTAVGIALGILGIAIDWYWRSPRRSKRLVWEARQATPVEYTPIGATGDETFTGTRYHVVIRVMNKGRDAITRGDYEVPVQFICRSLAVTAWVGRRKHEGIEAVAVLREGRLSYEPFLLNRGDWFDLEALYDDNMGGGPLSFFVYRGRIAGVLEIEDRKLRNQRRTVLQRILGAVSSIVVLIGAGLILQESGLTVDVPWAWYVGTLVLFAGLMLLFNSLGILRTDWGASGYREP